MLVLDLKNADIEFPRMHCYDDVNAIRFGIHAAVLIWVFRKVANNERAIGNYDEGVLRIRASISDLHNICPYMSEEKIKKALVTLVRGCVLKKTDIDHECMYSFTNYGWNISEEKEGKDDG